MVRDFSYVAAFSILPITTILHLKAQAGRDDTKYPIRDELKESAGLCEYRTSLLTQSRYEANAPFRSLLRAVQSHHRFTLHILSVSQNCIALRRYERSGHNRLAQLPFAYHILRVVY